MTDEPVEARNPRIVPASNLGEDVERHYVEMGLALELQPNEAFAIPKSGFSLKLLREIAEDMSTAQKPLVVFEHGDPPVFEVRRLQPGRSAKRFYAYVGKPEELATDEALEPKALVMQVIAGFFEKPPEDFATYEPKFTKEWQDERAFSYSMLSRRVVPLALFRKSQGGGTALLKKLLTELVSEGKLYEVPEAFAEQHFGTTGKVYRLLA